MAKSSHSRKIVTLNGKQHYINPLKSHKEVLWVRQNGRCWICGEMMAKNPMKNRDGSHDGRHATIDHLIPQSQGGSDNVNNLALACYTCNCLRGRNILKPLGARLNELEIELYEAKNEVNRLTAEYALWTVKETKYVRDLKLAARMFSSLRLSRDKAVNEMLRERRKVCKCWWCYLFRKTTLLFQNCFPWPRTS